MVRGPSGCGERATRLLLVSHGPLSCGVQACDNMTDAQQVLEASAEGQLPPVYGWFQCADGEWIEFDVGGEHAPEAGM